MCKKHVERCYWRIQRQWKDEFQLHGQTDSTKGKTRIAAKEAIIIEITDRKKKKFYEERKDLERFVWAEQHELNTKSWDNK